MEGAHDFFHGRDAFWHKGGGNLSGSWGGEKLVITRAEDVGGSADRDGVALKAEMPWQCSLWCSGSAGRDAVAVHAEMQWQCRQRRSGSALRDALAVQRVWHIMQLSGL